MAKTAGHQAPQRLVAGIAMPDGASTVLNVGRHLDIVVNTPDGFRFAQRLCAYDSEMVPNSIIHPI